VKGDDWGFGWNVGVLLDLPTRTRIGLSYRSTVTQELTGTATFENRPALLAAGLPDGDIRAEVTLPDTASIAVAQQVLPRLELLADYTWTGWSALQDLSIFRASGQGLTSTPLEFEDSWRAGLGASFQATDPLKLRAGVAHDRTPVQDEDRTPRLPDADRTWLAAGAQWAFSDRAAVDVGFAWLLLGDAPSALPNLDPAPPAGFAATPRGTLAGEYDGTVWIAGLQARYGF
jgi:long-chain fatty acid transport protein